LVDAYPSREIDRPYTLPDGMKSYGILATAWTDAKDNSEEEAKASNRAFLNPFYWETPVTDNLSVVWWPLPLGLKWQIAKDSDDRLGFSFMTAILASKYELAYRRHIAKDHALELSAHGFNYNLVFIEGRESYLRLGYLWQINDEHYLKAGIAPGRVNGDSKFFESLFEAAGVVTDFKYQQKVLAGDFGWGWRFHKQWNVDLAFTRIKARQGDLDIEGNTFSRMNLAFSHYWD
jgi:hypothetical protein